MQASGTPAARGRLAEVAALFASSADFAIGMPLDTTFRITGAALRLAAMLQLPESDRKDFYYLCLVRLMGCTVDNSQFAAAMGDEMEASRRMAAVDMASPTDMLPVLLGLRAGESLMRRASGLLTAVAFGAGMRSHIAGHCEVSQLLTDGLELGPRIRQTLDFTYERGDGRGAPTGSRAGRSRTSHGCSRPATTPPSRTWRGPEAGPGRGARQVRSRPGSRDGRTARQQNRRCPRGRLVIDFTGPAGGPYAVRVENGKGRLVPGPADDASLIFRLDPVVFNTVMIRRMQNPMLAMLTGKIHVNGFSKMPLMQKVFSPPSPDKQLTGSLYGG